MAPMTRAAPRPPWRAAAGICADQCSFTTTVKATINRLRAKLGDLPLIETVRERGYRIGGQP